MRLDIWAVLTLNFDLESNMKLCKDCKYFQNSDKGLGYEGQYAKCTRSVKKVDLVMGKGVEYYFCSSVRNSKLKSDCGVAGLHWEPIQQDMDTLGADPLEPTRMPEKDLGFFGKLFYSAFGGKDGV